MTEQKTIMHSVISMSARVITSIFIERDLKNESIESKMMGKGEILGGV